MGEVRVQAEDFDPGRELERLSPPGVGGIGSFIGVVRSKPDQPIAAMTLEHYPGMTERAIARIVTDAETRFGLLACTVIHRTGRLLPGERIVFVGAAAPHRAAVLDATAFLIDWLKCRAPFWKKEEYLDGRSVWVEAVDEDELTAQRWLGDAAPQTPSQRPGVFGNR